MNNLESQNCSALAMGRLDAPAVEEARRFAF